MNIASSSSRQKKPTASQIIEVGQSVPQQAAAWMLGVSLRYFQTLAEVPRNKDGTYNLRDLHAWDLERRTQSADDDPLLEGSSSPALERYRLARAIAAERENETASGRLVDVEQFEAWFQTEIASPLLRAVDALQSRYGEDAAGIVERVLERAESAVEKRSERNSKDDS